MHTTREHTEAERHSWQLVLLCWLSYVTIYIGKKTLSVCLPAMMAEGVCTNSTGGTIGTAFLICYAAGQFVNGWLGEKLPPRLMICTGLFFAGAMDVLMSFGHRPAWFMGIWGACGVFCSMLWAPIVRAVATWTTPEIGRTAGASLSATIPVGTIFCYSICSLTLRYLGWRGSFAVCGVILMAAALLLYPAFWRMKPYMTSPEPAPAVPAAEAAPSGVQKISVFCAGIAFAAGCILFNGMIKDGLDMWIPTVLENRFLHDPAVVSMICTILPICNIGGVYAAKTIISRLHWTELGVCSLLFAISAGAIGGAVLLMHSPATGFWAGMAATLLLAVSSAAMLGTNSMLLAFIPLHFSKIGRASALTGMLNCFSYAAAGAAGVAVGYVSEQMPWDMVILLFAGAALVGCVLAWAGRKPIRRKFLEMEQLGEAGGIASRKD